MSWLARSIANSLRLDDDDETSAGAAESPIIPEPQVGEGQHPQSSPSSAPSSPTARGVKEDLSEITKTLTRQFWGVASFLAPPPEPSSPAQISNSNPDQSEHEEHSDEDNYEEAVISGIRSDFAEISGRVKLGISKLSSNIAVSEISKIASNFLQLGSEEGSMEKYESIGVTEEVLAFVNNIAMHPETWLDFPVPDEDDNDDFDDFDMSDAQQDHALAVERLVPRLAALRMELCPGYMSDGCFWKIYFVLLHPRLDKHVALLLSTPQIMEARALLTRDLRNRTNPSYPKETVNSALEDHPSMPTDVQSESQPLKISAVEQTPSIVVSDAEMDKHAVQSTEIQIVDKSIIEEKPVNQSKYHHSSSEDDNDDWLKEDTSEIVGVNKTTMPNVNDEDVSFSDLEDDDDDGDVPAGYKKDGSDSSTKDSRDWVQLSRSSTDSGKDISSGDIKRAEQVNSPSPENKESNDWLDVDDIDVI